jgi:hypothetical protein
LTLILAIIWSPFERMSMVGPEFSGAGATIAVALDPFYPISLSFVFTHD